MEKTCSFTVVTVKQGRACLRTADENSKFMLEKDLTMVHWPLATEERQIFPSPIAPIGYVWLIADTETMNSLTAVLNEAEQ